MRASLRSRAAGAALLGLAVAAVAASPITTGAQGNGAEPQFVPNEVIIQFKEDATDAQKQDALGRAAAAAVERIHTAAMRSAGAPGLHVAATRRPVADAVRVLSEHPAVEFAEPNWIYTHTAASNDPYYTGGRLWGMYGDATAPANPFGSQAGEAWALGNTGSDAVYVGVIDEGIQVQHADLDGNVWINPYDPVDGVDNDGNGYVDDVNGWDFDGNNGSVYDGGKSGSSDTHGTHVAGTIGAEGGNGIGVTGVNWNVTVISAKFLGRRGGTTANAVKAVDYFTNLKVKHGLNIVATNNSWGGGGYSQALRDAIVRGAQQNILFIAAAGNGGGDQIGDNNDAVASYPSNYDTTSAAGYDAVIAVAALNSNGTRGSYSNYGAATVDLGAPGSGIYSTLPVNKYGTSSGTSMATPHVTGAAALYAATHPGSSALEIRNAILGSVVPTPSLQGITVTGGRLNVSGF